MKLIKPYLIFLLLLSYSAWGIQYKPLSSTERHELSSGFTFSDLSMIKNWKDKENRKWPSFFINYSFYFPEIGSFLPSAYKNIFIPGLHAGLNLFKPEDSRNLCEDPENSRSAAYHFGIKAKSSFFEFVQPFAEWGLARSLCLNKSFSENSPAKTKLRHYVSYGLFLSLKALDKGSVYALDQDYGINDTGLKMECLHYYPKAVDSFRLCQIGFQLSF